MNLTRHHDIFPHDFLLTVASCLIHVVLDSIVVSIPACHAGDRGSIPRRGGLLSLRNFVL